MRGSDEQTGSLLSYVSCEARVPADHPLRLIRAVVDEALDVLHKAVDLRPSYEDAMAYINLTYRRKAEIECGNADARKADVQQALDWTQKALGARKANVLKANQSTKPGVDTTK